MLNWPLFFYIPLMITKNAYYLILLVAVSGLSSCEKKPETLFQLKSSEDTGISFSNTIKETEDFNILTYEYIYNGGGVAVSDFNNDGLKDLFFTGNEVGNRLYLNKGGFKFEDITEHANVNVAGRWNSGVTVVDINNDGWMDMYVCATMKKDSVDRMNMLFINKGLNDKGVPVFEEQAKQYGIADGGYSINSAFFDYDRDGDLDLYVLSNVKLNNFPTNYRPKITDGSSPNNDKLYRNNGDNTFTNVTKQSGILLEGFGLGLSITDFNGDGWPDIYVSNDYLSNDILYINNKNGTFTNRIAEFIGHQSQFSMGNDAADINNDAQPDIITLDMLPEINQRKKTTISNKNYLTYINTKKYNYEYQYVRNMVHLNNGLNQEIKFSEVGEFSGVYQTEWSWSPLFADFDNDGNKDLLITNGFPKDISDKDFANFRADVGNLAGVRYLMDSIPIVRIPNYAYKNNGDLTFTNVTKQWGMATPCFSNGAAFVDLDNDGDLDYVINNINDQAFVYENTLYNASQKKEEVKTNFLRVKLVGNKGNSSGIGAKVILHYKGKTQYSEQEVSRGFLSSVEDIVHFGLGGETTVDSVTVQWPNGKQELIKDVKANQILTVTESNAHDAIMESKPMIANLLFEKINRSAKVAYKHEEEDQIDYNLQRTMPHKFSQAGPGVSVGDINNDGLEDFIVGGAQNNYTTVFVQKGDGTFVQEKNRLNEKDKQEEDEGLLLFDADGDHDLDLYVVSGSIEPGKSYDMYQDRLFINDGKGNFVLNVGAIPETKSSGSCVRAADFDADGDLDLFVGGRVVPGSYPLPAESYLLRNDGGKFVNATEDVCKELKAPGLVTDALWTDFDSDGKVDLIVVGEFMPITFFKNNGSKLTKLDVTGIEKESGWWNSITSGDFDNDGDIDYVVGNLGLNNNYQVTNQYPLKAFAKDFDSNNSIDVVLACYQRESMESDVKKLYPIHFWDELNSQSPKFRKRFASYKKYGEATIDKVLTPEELKGATILEANNMASSYVENLGNGKFAMKALPSCVQFAPVNGLITDDVNNDGKLDVVAVGNDYGNEIFAGRYDALTGLVLLGSGKGTFEPVASARSGFYVGGDAKALTKLFDSKGNEVIIASQNLDSLKLFRNKKKEQVVAIEAMDSYAEVTHKDGKKTRAEFYYGSGYLSQSSRKFQVPASATEITIYDFAGKSRKISPMVQ